MTREAACHCGQLRLDVTGEPQTVSICNCLACQRPVRAIALNQPGSPSVTWISSFAPRSVTPFDAGSTRTERSSAARNVVSCSITPAGWSQSFRVDVGGVTLRSLPESVYVAE